MAAKSTLTAESLQALGLEKLVLLVLDEAGQNPAFRRLVTAALAGKSGPDAIAKLIDKRLAGLQRARSFVDWDKAARFRDDLQATVTTITRELGPMSPRLGTDRLLRFLATQAAVFDRVDDSSGAIQGLYGDAAQDLGRLVARLAPGDADLVPEQIMAALDDGSEGYLVPVAEAVAGHLPDASLVRWSEALAERQAWAKAGQRPEDNGYSYAESQYRRMRQIIADARGDLDGFMALEAEKKPHMRNTVAIADRLLAAGRLPEALNWVQRDRRDLRGEAEPEEPERAGLEAQILTALGQKAAAQSLRWTAFTQTLDVGLLRDHVAALPDFEDDAVLSRAFAYVIAHQNSRKALAFLLAWPRRDLAAALVVARRAEWSGQDYYTLPPVADALQHEHPLAATILLRVLLDDILARARSKAYSYGARYLKTLALLAPGADADPQRPGAVDRHGLYRAGLQAAHGKKAAFWALVGP